jgi:hypothetical protein
VVKPSDHSFALLSWTGANRIGIRRKFAKRRQIASGNGSGNFSKYPRLHLTKDDICLTSVSMSKKKGESPASTVKAPRMVSVRDFVRGGYQHVDEPMLVMNQSRALFAVYPVETSVDYLASQVLTPTHADPAWLTRGMPSSSLAMSHQVATPRARRKAGPAEVKSSPPVVSGEKAGPEEGEVHA